MRLSIIMLFLSSILFVSCFAEGVGFYDKVSILGIILILGVTGTLFFGTIAMVFGLFEALFRGSRKE
jgi:hypothetical protein